jgi:hypothetical protein
MPSFVPAVLFGSSGIHTTLLETAVAFTYVHEYWALIFHVGGKINSQLPFHEDTKGWCTKIRLYFYLLCYCMFLCLKLSLLWQYSLHSHFLLASHVHFDFRYIRHENTTQKPKDKF